jgi:CRISPR-associated endonuclease Csn1
MNAKIVSLNNGEYHQPILKVRTYEPKGNKFNVGIRGNKKSKFVVAEAGTNLFFAIYVDRKGKRSYETIPLNIIIERLKQGEKEVPETIIIKDTNEGNGVKELKLLFSLSPNDLVYVPTDEDILNEVIFNAANMEIDRIYKFTDSSDTTANFIPMHSASLILNMKNEEQKKRGLNFGIQNEYGVGSPQSKNQKSITGEMIKDVCIKVKTDRLGNIII